MDIVGKKFITLLLLNVCIFLSPTTYAFKNNSWWAGLGYYTENSLFVTAQKPDSSAGLLGEESFPLNIKYDYALNTSWFLAPQLSYTLLPRDTAGKTAEVTTTHLNFLIGKNTSAQGFDWSFGPGYFSQTIKGKGGTVVMNNGNSNATFAKPGKSSTIKKVTFNLGGSYTSGRYRFGLDLFVIAPMSSKERTQNIMFSIAYQLGGTSSGSSGGQSFSGGR